MPFLSLWSHLTQTISKTQLTSADNRSKRCTHAPPNTEVEVNRFEREEKQQLAEELAARGVRLDDAREWFEVGMVDDEPTSPPGARAPRHTRRGWQRPRRSQREPSEDAS